MIEDTEDCGCDSGPAKKLESNDVDFIKNKMSETKDTLETMLNSIKGLDFNADRFQKMESEIEKVSEFIHSGEFVKSMETMFEKGMNRPGPNQEFFKDYFDKKQNYVEKMFGGIDSEQIDVLQNFVNIKPPKPKTPIGYVYVDENGEQRFSPIKPDGVSSTAVYGD